MVRPDGNDTWHVGPGIETCHSMRHFGEVTETSQSAMIDHNHRAIDLEIGPDGVGEHLNSRIAAFYNGFLVAYAAACLCLKDFGSFGFFTSLVLLLGAEFCKQVLYEDKQDLKKTFILTNNL